MKEAEEQLARERLAEKERIAIQKEADEIFNRNEVEKAGRRRQDAEQVAHFRVAQAVSKIIFTSCEDYNLQVTLIYTEYHDMLEQI